MNVRAENGEMDVREKRGTQRKLHVHEDPLVIKTRLVNDEAKRQLRYDYSFT